MKDSTRRARFAAGLARSAEQERYRVARHRLPGVYFIAVGFEMKIGHSADPHARMRKLQTGSSQPLQLIHVIHEPNEEARVQLERELHEKFSDQHIRAEWFKMALPYNYAYALCRKACVPTALNQDQSGQCAESVAGLVSNAAEPIKDRIERLDDSEHRHLVHMLSDSHPKILKRLLDRLDEQQPVLTTAPNLTGGEGR